MPRVLAFARAERAQRHPQSNTDGRSFRWTATTAVPLALSMLGYQAAFAAPGQPGIAEPTPGQPGITAPAAPPPAVESPSILVPYVPEPPAPKLPTRPIPNYGAPPPEDTIVTTPPPAWEPVPEIAPEPRTLRFGTTVLHEDDAPWMSMLSESDLRILNRWPAWGEAQLSSVWRSIGLSPAEADRRAAMATAFAVTGGVVGAFAVGIPAAALGCAAGVVPGMFVGGAVATALSPAATLPGVGLGALGGCAGGAALVGGAGAILGGLGGGLLGGFIGNELGAGDDDADPTLPPAPEFLTLRVDNVVEPVAEIVDFVVAPVVSEASVELAPVAEDLAPAVGQLAQDWAPAIEQVQTTLAPVQDTLAAVAAVAAPVIDPLIAAAEPMIAPFADVLSQIPALAPLPPVQ